MQKYRFIQYLAFLLFLPTLTFAQPKVWYDAYLDNDLPRLQADLSSERITNPDWKQFVQAIFIEDVEEAFPQFISVYQRTQDQLLKRIILDRISQYYYAKGLYETANRILTDAEFRNQIFSVREEQIYFGVQLGAFSSMDNAELARKKYSGKINDISIIIKDASGKKLYAVIAGKFRNRADAEKLESEIKAKFGKKGMITQY